MMRICLALLLWGSAVGSAAAMEPMEWMQRMFDSMSQSDYRGTFVYSRGQSLDAMELSHRNQDGVEQEHLRLLTGSERELLRRNQDMLCVWPSAQKIHHQVPQAQSISARFNSKTLERLPLYYQPELGEQQRVAGEACQEVRLQPVDALRYAQRYCVGEESGLMLRAEILDTSGVTLERIMFTEMEVQPEFAEADFVLSTEADAYERESVEPEVLSTEEPAVVHHELWPAGFERVAQRQRVLPHQQQAQHWVFSDGLARVSVFFEELPADAPAQSRQLKKGIYHVHQTDSPGRRITVVGEVPAKTVRLMAEALQ